MQKATTVYQFPGDAVTDYITRHLSDPAQRQREADSLKREILAAIYQPQLSYNSASISDSDQHYQVPTMSKARSERLQQAFRANLYYSAMDDRQSRIAEAHGRTFRWLFSDEAVGTTRKWSSFTEWLASDTQLYWITGKAGSGKSTLMKFIGSYRTEDHEESIAYRRLLGDWAGDTPLVVVSFYFWASGATIDSSKEGLLRSVLYQILQRCPNIVSSVAPHTWEAMSLFDTPPCSYSLEELYQMLINAVKHLHGDHKLCFFVDGLDEFDGDVRDLVKLFQSVLGFKNTKLCAASRPWTVFEDAFQNRPSLMLQDLSYPDIQIYVTSSLGEDDGFKRLQEREPHYADELIEEIIGKAAGVFLWVHLVIRSLLTGMSNDDRIIDLRRRLDQLPPDLEQLYDAILKKLDPFYREHTAQYFRLMKDSQTVPALVFSFFDEETPEFVFALPVQTLSKAEHDSRTNTVRRRINSRCGGLLEVGPQSEFNPAFPYSPAVQFLHKTVKDYVNKSAFRTQFATTIDDDDDFYLRICAAYLGIVKVTLGMLLEEQLINAGTDDMSSVSMLARFAKDCLRAASKVSKKSSYRMIRLLDNLESTIQKAVPERSVNNFYRQTLEPKALRSCLKPDYGTGILSFAVRLGVVEYVKARAPRGCVVPGDSIYTGRPVSEDWAGRAKFKRMLPWADKRKLAIDKAIASLGPNRWPLLLDAVFSRPLNLEMLECLFEKGVNWNYPVQGLGGPTVWEEVLTNLIFAIGGGLETGELQEWEAITVCLWNGARVERQTVNSTLDRVNRKIPFHWDPNQVYQALEDFQKGQRGVIKNLFVKQGGRGGWWGHASRLPRLLIKVRRKLGGDILFSIVVK